MRAAGRAGRSAAARLVPPPARTWPSSRTIRGGEGRPRNGTSCMRASSRRYHTAEAMPANLTPDYKAAEAAYREARDPHERLECLREMLRLMPKHKGTDHLQGDIKRRIKELSEELERPQRGGAHGGPPLMMR